MTLTEDIIILAGCFLSAAGGWLGCYLWRRGRERRAADDAWRMATTFHGYKNREKNDIFP